MHHQLNRYCPVLWCRVCGRGRLGGELRDGGVDGAPDVTDRHVLAHGAQTYVNVWPPAARGGTLTLTLTRELEPESVTSSGSGILKVPKT